MADNSGGSNALAIIVGALLIAAVVFGGFMFLGQKTAPSGPSVNITAPAKPG